jgi:hypothetical protein
MENLVFLVMLVVGAVVLMRVFNRSGTLKCTRCDGTGNVNEKWPDPNESSGWHIVEGICPKCKGKGKI